MTLVKKTSKPRLKLRRETVMTLAADDLRLAGGMMAESQTMSPLSMHGGCETQSCNACPC
jgi:hypothetical protein